MSCNKLLDADVDRKTRGNRGRKFEVLLHVHKIRSLERESSLTDQRSYEKYVCASCIYVFVLNARLTYDALYSTAKYWCLSQIAIQRLKTDSNTVYQSYRINKHYFLERMHLQRNKVMGDTLIVRSRNRNPASKTYSTIDFRR
ncbi:uncharacterized protein PRCAT00002522001 [Priceomyces carsonii]|uniref:uncharacterized protein n=1 Tax=Priceomyces carsonii TaxID=28549 RepID=UPI002ED8925D|nr:unnamed protein product [Priceomyces carsonii]